MELNKFLENLKNVFEDTDPKTITAGANFKDLENYSSLIALSIIAMVDEEYNVKLKGNDIREAHSIEDLFNKIKLK